MEPSVDPFRGEPVFRGPWSVWTLVAMILGAYALQSWTMDVSTAARDYALSPAELAQGRWPPLFTDLFIHGGWAHAGMNAAGALAFGTPAARFLGAGARGTLGFFLLYILCGVISNLGYAALHWHDITPVAGASGAVSGLFGASSRMIERRGGLSPFLSRTVLITGLAWIGVNVVFGVLHVAPGMGADVQVAWEAHIAGFLAGLFLIAPIGLLFRDEQERLSP